MFLFTSVAIGRPAGDTTFRSGSGIKEVWLHDTKATELAHLGMLWGFLKYHHPDATSGAVDMDAELFRVMPQVIAAANMDSSYAIMERWVDRMGVPAACRKCVTNTNEAKTFTGPDYASLFITTVPQSLRSKLDSIKKNRESSKNRQYVKMATEGNPEFLNERPYDATPYPDAGMRLLALYRYWNIVQYYAPNRHATRNRGRMLADMVQEFANAGDTLAYQLACLRLFTRINDGHGRLDARSKALETHKGIYITPFKARFVEDQLVVTGYYKDTLNITGIIKPGDVIEMIDGMGMIDLIRKYLDIVPASNHQAKLAAMAGADGFLLRGAGASAKLSISRNGERRDITVPRIRVAEWMRKADAWHTNEQGYRMLAGNIGYIYPAGLAGSDLKNIQASFENAKGIIVDMRCYPAVSMMAGYTAWLKPEASAFAKQTTMNIDIPGLFEFGDPILTGGEKGKHYTGKLMILVDETTHSSAEYQSLALRSMNGAQVIGSRTAGANGATAEIVLPGGIRTWLSGVGIFYPDGTATQVEGLRIDKEVRPTIKGIAAGKDEVLDEAVRMLSE
ncbi:hypothetical protein GCM10023093_19390 [Nemorincola caseinilytica]|uniref:Tail specific protease domain-containing protein n=1 Tax=Nemorincola caseinilytica TaxID=2054315 RepID=A0ABP8NEL6_9BACT